MKLKLVVTEKVATTVKPNQTNAVSERELIRRLTIRYVLPVLWMRSYLHTIKPAAWRSG